MRRVSFAITIEEWNTRPDGGDSLREALGRVGELLVKAAEVDRRQSDVLLGKAAEIIDAALTAPVAKESPPPPGYAYASTEDLMKTLGVPNAKRQAAVVDGIASGTVSVLPVAKDGD